MKLVLRTELIKEKENNLSPKLSSSKEKREKTIRIRKYNYDRMKKLGDLSMDWDDVLTLLLDFYFEKKDKNR
jgi:hypothetical protein